MLRQPCALYQGLAVNAAVVQAVAAHFVSFSQGDFGFHSRCDVGRHQATSAPTDDDQVAVKLEWPLALPARVDFAPLQQRQSLACGQRQQTEHGKRAQDGRREHAGQRVDLRQLRAGIHISQRAGQHAELADPVKSPGLHARQTHQQIECKKRHYRYQAQREKIKTTVTLHTLVDAGEPAGKAFFSCAAQQVTRTQHGQRSPQAGRK